MNKFEIEQQRMVDEETLHYVRGMQNTAPITAEAVHGYLVKTRRHRDLTLTAVKLRLDYLVDKDQLKEVREWVAGEGDVKFYKITAHGVDVIDGIVAPD